MRKLLVTMVTLVALGTLAGPAVAAKGGGGGSTTQPASIDLCQVDGVAVNGCASSVTAPVAAPRPHLGGTVNFATTYPKVPGNTVVRIQVICYQSGALVYGEAYNSDQTFLLGGGWSLWLENGGAASCTADLYYWSYKGATQTFVPLSSMTFEADGPAA